MLRQVVAEEIDSNAREAASLGMTRSIVLPPGSWGVGRTLDDIRAAGAKVEFNGIRRQGIVGRNPNGGTELREGDIVIIYGTPEALEHAESVLLAG
jgi:CPA2 family monovalent cation:H+ antiporter-2